MPNIHYTLTQSNFQNLELQCKLFTASEYRAWLLFYCLPVLNGILPPTYLKHLALLVCSMHILLGARISQESLPVVEYMLDKFYCQFEELYGKLALNVQWIPAYTQSLLVHYAWQVSKTAPWMCILWVIALIMWGFMVLFGPIHASRLSPWMDTWCSWNMELNMLSHRYKLGDIIPIIF